MSEEEQTKQPEQPEQTEEHVEETCPVSTESESEYQQPVTPVIDQDKVEVKEVETITLTEFKAWMRGIEEMQEDDDWSPNPKQWNVIKRKIRSIEVPVTGGQPTAYPTPSMFPSHSIDSIPQSNPMVPPPGGSSLHSDAVLNQPQRPGPRMPSGVIMDDEVVTPQPLTPNQRQIPQNGQTLKSDFD